MNREELKDFLEYGFSSYLKLINSKFILERYSQDNHEMYRFLIPSKKYKDKAICYIMVELKQNNVKINVVEGYNFEYPDIFNKIYTTLVNNFNFKKIQKIKMKYGGIEIKALGDFQEIQKVLLFLVDNFEIYN